MGWLSKFKKSKPDEIVEEQAKDLTFKQRVETFWKWYSAVAARFHDTIEAGKCGDLTSEMSERVHELLTGFGWVFGPGENGEGHSFTLTPEADEPRQHLAEYWLSKAPSLDGWTFYDARQPGKTQGIIRIKGNDFGSEEVWVTPKPNEENECFDITIWHPLFTDLPERDCYQIIFLWLDEILGERGTKRWIGKIEFSDTELKGAIPLDELRDLAEKTKSTKGWNETQGDYCTYRHESQQGGQRKDIYVGSTCCFSIVQDYFENYAPTADNPISGLGAHYVFLSLSLEDFPTEDEVDFRAAIEDRIEAQFTENQSGKLLGGAMGTTRAYIDLLIFDGENSISQIREAIEGSNLTCPVKLYPFYQDFGDPVVIQ